VTQTGNTLKRTGAVKNSAFLTISQHFPGYKQTLAGFLNDIKEAESNFNYCYPPAHQQKVKPDRIRRAP
jgi:hypothetical protein